jgi:hypothetical protein
MNRVLRLPAWALSALLLVGPSAGATSVVKTDVDGLTRSSDLVVRGKVKKKESRWSGDHKRIYTDVEIEVDESIKGQGGKTVTVRQPGGEVGDIAQRVSGLASFDSGEEVVVFLEKRGGVYRVSGLAQGKYRVERSSDGKFAFAVPADQSELRLVDPQLNTEAAPSAKTVQLEELRERVRKVVKAAGAGKAQP